MNEPLTPARIKTLEKGKRVRDSRVTALLYHSRGEGTGSFLLRYRARNTGTERTIKVGRYPDMSLDAARSVARDMLQQVAQGRDPKQDWDTARAEPTVADLVARYIESKQDKRAPGTIEAYTIQSKSPRFAGTRLARMRVNEVTGDDASAFLSGLAKQGLKSGANRYRALLLATFNAALFVWKDDARKPLRKIELGNPFKGTDKRPETPRKRFVKPDEFNRFWQALDELASSQPRHAAALELMLVTGLRRVEVTHCKAAWLQGAEIVYPEHKTSAYIGEKRVPVPAQVLALLQRSPSDDGYLFGKLDMRWAWDRIRELSGLHDLQMRDLRRTFASIAASQGKSLLQIGKQLGHTNPQTTNRYAWMFEADKATLSQEVADAIYSSRPSTSQAD